MGPQETKSLAEKIADLIAEEAPTQEPSTLHASLEKINQRLGRLEQALLDLETPQPTFQHPSLHRFNVAETIADQIFGGRQEEKACQYEPGKPCDHCSMCSSRGF